MQYAADPCYISCYCIIQVASLSKTIKKWYITTCIFKNMHTFNPGKLQINDCRDDLIWSLLWSEPAASVSAVIHITYEYPDVLPRTCIFRIFGR